MKMENTRKYIMPPEWEYHKGTLLAWPGNEETWGEYKFDVQKEVAALIAVISRYENVYLSVNPDDNKELIIKLIDENENCMKRINLTDIPNNDAWMRDYGPNYVFADFNGKIEKAINNWGYNAWGGKYPPWDKDEAFTKKFSLWIQIKKYFDIQMILEGGSIDVNGGGLLLTTESCLLNKNRNPQFTKKMIEDNLRKHLGVNHIVWLKEGINGDDTDGHIDDFARFINKDTILCNYSHNKEHRDFQVLQNNYNDLIDNEDLKNHNIQIKTLPIPDEAVVDGIALPLSYANFYFVNGAVLVPVFNDSKDDEALEIIKNNCHGRDVIGIPSINILTGLGGVHCLTQQVY